MNILLGILTGLLSALSQSFNYVVSGRYAREESRPAHTLLAPAFLLMGVVSLVALPFAWPSEPPDWGRVLPPAALCIAFCLLANVTMVFLLKHVDSSRSAPLLALKVPLLALFYSVFLGQRCTPTQWAGVALVVVASVLLCGAGRRIPPVAFAWLFATCAGYSASDYCIQLTFEAAAPYCHTLLHKTFFSLFLIYVIGGVIGGVALLAMKRPSKAVWVRHAIPYACLWFGAMVVLFCCFALCGVVLGNIVQSTRGLLSVVIGWFIARAGYTNLEERVGGATMARRVAAAVLIVAAMALYALGAGRG